MMSLKLIPRDWVKSRLEDVLWVISRKNNLHVKFKEGEGCLRAFCSDNEYMDFKRIAHKFCLVCGPFAA